MITVEHLTRNYGDFCAVDDVSFKIGSGEIVGLLGHNGAGKSTIMKMLTGYLQPHGGRVVIAGHDMATAARSAQRLIGYLPENCPVYPEMSVIDFLDYSAVLHGLEPKQRAAALRLAIERTALEEKALSPIAALSRGYRQRLGVAQALLHQPQIVILDEPTNGLDPGQIEHMRTLIRELGKSATVLVSTHILQEVAAVCDRVLILRHGRLALDAALADLVHSDAVVLETAADADGVAQCLRQLDGVTAVETCASTAERQRLRVQVVDDEVVAVLAREMAAHQWPLYQLQRQERTLEKVFHEITATEVEQHAA